MGHEELKEIGINAYGHRHKLIKGIERLLGGQQGQWTTHTQLSDCDSLPVSLLFDSPIVCLQVQTRTWRSTAPARAPCSSTWRRMTRSSSLWRRKYANTHFHNCGCCFFFSTTTFPEEGSTFFLMLMMSDSRHLAEETAHTVIVAVAPFLSEQTADISLNEWWPSLPNRSFNASFFLNDHAFPLDSCHYWVEVVRLSSAVFHRSSIVSVVGGRTHFARGGAIAKSATQKTLV